MATALDPKTMVSPNELLMSQDVSNEAIIRLLIEKGIFTKEEFLEMVNVVNLEIGKMGWKPSEGVKQGEGIWYYSWCYRNNFCFLC